jgi:cyclopropane-fatty-acyl-phospholipid synthase
VRAWVSNIEAGWDQAVALAGAARARVWRLYMTGSARSFDLGRIAIHQVLGVRPDGDGRSQVPMVRTV